MYRSEMAMAIAEKTSKKQAIEAESCIIWYWTAMNLYKLEYVSESSFNAVFCWLSNSSTIIQVASLVTRKIQKKTAYPIYCPKLKYEYHRLILLCCLYFVNRKIIISGDMLVKLFRMFPESISLMVGPWVSQYTHVCWYSAFLVIST